MEPPDLLERDAELAALDALIAAAPEGGRLLVIEGPPGIGKTGLLAEARARGRAAGMRVLAARGSELEQEVSYGVVRQLFEPLLASARADERDDLLAGAAALANPIFDPAHLGTEPDAESTHAMLHGLFWLTANLGERESALLAIDDLHWCDAPSLRWLAYLLPRMEGLPVLTVATLRSAPPEGTTTLLALIATDPLATVVRPAALSEDATGRLLSEVLSAQSELAFRVAFHEQSGGNPLLVRELAKAVAAERLALSADDVPRLRELGAQGISRAVALRLSSLPGTATSLARAVAILGDDAQPRHAAALAGLDDAAVADAAEALVRIEILRRDALFGFVHPLVRTAVYLELSAVERDRGHARAARVLADAGADPERIAAQLLLATPTGDDSAVTFLRTAARSAVARGAPDGAVAYLRHALDGHGPTSAELLRELGAAEAMAARPEAAQHLAAAHAATGDPLQRAAIALDWGIALFEVEGSAGAAVEVVQQALRDLGDRDPELALELEAFLVGIARFDVRFQQLATERLDRIRGTVSGVTPGERIILACLASESGRVGIELDAAVDFAERALAGDTLLRKHFDPAFLYAVLALVSAGHFDAAFRLFTEAMEDGRRRGLVRKYYFASCYRALVSFQRGALADAVADGELSLDAIGANAPEITYATAILGGALVELGETARAGELIDSVAVGETMSSYRHALHFETRARLLLADREYARALATTLELGRFLDEFGVDNPALAPWRSLAASALLALDEKGEARRYAREELRRARRWGAGRPLGVALVAAGRAEGGAEGLTLLSEAAAVLESSQARLEHGRALIELGAALRRANRRSDAREPLRRGLELATACGAVTLAEHGATELLATGARPRRIALSGVDSLTPSERRVAQMAAAGRTNREVAQALFVTPKTVEVHLTSVYRKLDISSRRDLVRALAAGDQE